MKTITKAMLVLLVLGTTACTRPDRFGGAGADGAGAGAGAAVDAGAGLTGANDPSSPQFFAQTIGDRVLFEVDQSTLTAAGRATLDGQANWLQPFTLKANAA